MSQILKQTRKIYPKIILLTLTYRLSTFSFLFSIQKNVHERKDRATSTTTGK